jgi:Protein phosphatase 2C
MVRRIETDEFVELSAEQRSNETQYESFCSDTAGGDHSVRVSLGYRRCLDFDEGNHPGQDYATVRIGGDYIVGIVADGVSQSFYGNIAAQRVSQWLLEKLWNHRSHPPDQKILERALTGLEKHIAPEIESVQIPEHVSEIMKTALEKTRASGSQTVFAAFVSNGKGAVRLYQVGDITAVLHNSAGEVEVIKAHPKGRWSSAGKSRFEMLVTDRTGLSSILIKSDGMNNDWGLNSTDDRITKDAFEQSAPELAGKDDVSFIAVTQLNTRSVHADAVLDSITTPRPDAPSPANVPDKHQSVLGEGEIKVIGERVKSQSLPAKNPARWRDAALIIVGVVLGFAIALAYSKLIDRNTSRTHRPTQTAPDSSNRQTEIRSAEVAPNQLAPTASPASNKQQETAKQKPGSGRSSASTRRPARPRPANSNQRTPASTNTNQNSNAPNVNQNNRNERSVTPPQLQRRDSTSGNANLVKREQQHLAHPAFQTGIFQYLIAKMSATAPAKSGWANRR